MSSKKTQGSLSKNMTTSSQSKRWRNTIVDNPGKYLDIIRVKSSYEVVSPWKIGFCEEDAGGRVVLRGGKKYNLFYLAFVPSSIKPPVRIRIENDLPFWKMQGETWKKLVNRVVSFSGTFDSLPTVTEEDMEDVKMRASGGFLDV